MTNESILLSYRTDNEDDLLLVHAAWPPVVLRVEVRFCRMFRVAVVSSCAAAVAEEVYCPCTETH